MTTASLPIRPAQSRQSTWYWIQFAWLCTGRKRQSLGSCSSTATKDFSIPHKRTLTCYIITHITNTYFVIIIPGMNITKHCDDIIIHTGRGSLFNLAASSAGRSLRPLSYSNSFMSRMQVVSYFSADFKAGYEL